MVSLRLSVLALITLLSGTALAGNLTVNLGPAGAVTAGGQWRVDAGAWRGSGTTVKNLSNASHTVEYKAVSGWIAPPTATVTLTNNVTTTVTGTYVQPSSIVVTLNPSAGQWRVDGGAWRNSGTTASGLTPGSHSLSYNALTNYTAPATETINLIANQTTNLSRTYTATSSLIVTLTPSSASWQVDTGAWQPSGATVAGLTPGSHTLNFGSASGMLPRPSETITLPAAQTTSLSRSYTAEAGLIVNVTPTTAQWRVDAGAWRSSGERVGQLTAGNHTIDYNAAPGYFTPSSETVALVSGQTATLTRSYASEAALIVNLTPGAAQWRVDAGVWRDSGERVGQLAAGNHSVSYSAIAGFQAPASETVSLVGGQTMTLLRSYSALASLTVTLTPSSASWQVDGGLYRASGYTITGLTPGSHTISYTGVSAMLSPPAESATLVGGQATSLSRSYTPAGQIFTMLNPNTAQWRVDGGAWRATHTYTEWIAVGAHTIEYSPVAGKVTPAADTVNVIASQVLQVSKTYATECGLIINLTPAVGQWRVDGGAWRNSGERTGQLVVGQHAVEYGAASGYTAPPNETVFLGTYGDTTIARSYLAPASVTVNVVPGEGQWRLSNGPWQASGATVTGLRPGSYGVEFASVSGWFDVPSYSVALAENEAKNLTYEHIRHASVTATLAPGSALWRLNGGAWQPSGVTIGALYSGNYTIEYSAIAGMNTPPNETFALTTGQQKTLPRSYGGASSLTVNLSAGVGQWRIDGGGWQTGGSIAFGLQLGSHVIEYAPVNGYIAPPSETVWFRLNQSLNLTRSYRDSSSAYLAVKTVPAYLTEQGIVKWRVSGGAWNTAGTAVAVAPGTYTLEFQPVAGLDVPAASSVTVIAGSVQTFEATVYLPHRLRFFLHSDLVAGLSSSDLQTRLGQYAAHLQAVWDRESLRRVQFDTATDISVVSASPFSGSAMSPLPEYGFELWVYADAAGGSIYGSNSGHAALDASGAGGADGMHWTQIYDPAALLPGSTELYEYWKQIDATTHEFEHVFGAGSGEYYSAAEFIDSTGVAPLYSVDYFTSDDPFWNSHTDAWADPLLRTAWSNFRIGNPTTLPTLLDSVHFSGTSRGIINACYRNASFRVDGGTALPDLSRVRVSVVDANTGQPIAGSSLRIWNRPNPSATGGQERTVLSGGTPGVYEFNWTPDPQESPLGNWENGKLLKASATGYQPKAQWEWIYDAQRVKTVDNLDVWEITVALTPVP